MFVNKLTMNVVLLLSLFIVTPVLAGSLVEVDDKAGQVNSLISKAGFEYDNILSISSAKLWPANCYQLGQNIEMTIDGDHQTIYHSPWSGFRSDKPVVLEYKLNKDKSSQLDYMVLYPRSTGSNGIIKKARIWVNTQYDPGFKLVEVVNIPQSNEAVFVNLKKPVQQPNIIRIEIEDAWSSNNELYFVSLAEIECYQKAQNHFEKDSKYFTDQTFSDLKEGLTRKQLKKIKNPVLYDIALKIYENKYQKEYRVQNYLPYRPVDDLAKELKTSTYSQFENMTGIHFTKGEKVIVFVGETSGEKVKLRVRDFGKSGDDHVYPLFEGVNILTMKGQGNGYVNYFTVNYNGAEPVKINIYGGLINGVFKSEIHNEEDGRKLLENAVSEVLDICGERTQLIYSVKELKEAAYGRLGEMINLYDSIIGHQYHIMGLTQYDRVPENHILGRVVWKGYMHADGFGAAFSFNTMNMVANPDNIRDNCWGIAHEFGHVNQVRPGMKWVGTSECTNNIYSAWSQYVFNPQSLRLEHEKINGIIGGRYNAYLNNAILEKQEWGLQCGPDANQYKPNEKGQWGGDHFVKLVPLWQLHLYYHVAGEGNKWHKPYFWGDIFEQVRRTDDSKMSDGQLQMSFVKNTCDAVQQDLSDFFLKIGFLTPVNKIFGDYRPAQKTITSEMVEEVINYAKKYPKPESDAIFYISGNSIDAYQDRLPVEGLYNKGITGNTLKCISHDVWKNVTIFETYHNDELKCITMVGTGDKANTKTLVPYLDGATRIEAVSWDGRRTLVFGTR